MSAIKNPEILQRMINERPGLSFAKQTHYQHNLKELKRPYYLAFDSNEGQWSKRIAVDLVEQFVSEKRIPVGVLKESTNNFPDSANLRVWTKSETGEWVDLVMQQIEQR